jgi:hypothetical protein
VKRKIFRDSKKNIAASETGRNVRKEILTVKMKELKCWLNLTISPAF